MQPPGYCLKLTVTNNADSPTVPFRPRLAYIMPEFPAAARFASRLLLGLRPPPPGLTLQPWRWRWYGPPTYLALSEVHGIKICKNLILHVTTVTTWNTTTRFQIKAAVTLNLLQGIESFRRADCCSESHEIISFHGIWRLITIFTERYCSILSWASWIQFTLQTLDFLSVRVEIIPTRGYRKWSHSRKNSGQFCTYLLPPFFALSFICSP
jgi:hypothetical protein